MVTPKSYWGFEYTYIRLHGNFVAYYAVGLANTLEIDPYKIGTAAYYHDYGKHKWPPALFTKKELTEKDWEIIKRHPQDTLDILFSSLVPDISRAKLLEGAPSVADIIYMHHEKPDGSGYYGIKNMPIEAAIVSIADIFDACLSDRTYKRGVSIGNSLECALSPFRDYLKNKGINPKDIESRLIKMAMKFKFEKVLNG